MLIAVKSVAAGVYTNEGEAEVDVRRRTGSLPKHYRVPSQRQLVHRSGWPTGCTRSWCSKRVNGMH